MRLNDRLRIYRDKYTRPVDKYSQGWYWEKELKELDENLSLRWNCVEKHWSVYYDRHGKVTCIKTFRPDEGFHRAFVAIKLDGQTTARDMIRQTKEDAEREERLKQDKIHEAGMEFGKDITNRVRRRVISDDVITKEMRR